MARCILAIDQGTTGTTALLMGTDGATLGRANQEFPQHFPQPGWVEHEPAEIWESVGTAVREALRQSGVSPSDVAAIGITNQRETTLVWDRKTGAPLARAMVWQDRRTSPICRELKEAGHEPRVSQLTGLVLDPYFSGTKLTWLLDNVEGLRARAESGQACFGTVDSYLIYQLAGGANANAPHVTDVTNASRTLLMNIESRQWEPQMLDLLRVPSSILPRIEPSVADFCRTKGFGPLPDGVPVCGVAGDQHAALFGQTCLSPGDVKCTYGTGAFIVMNTGATPIRSKVGLLTTIGWQIGSDTVYALEGSCFVAGAAVQWLRDGLGIIENSSDIEQLAASVGSSDGVVFVPALAGLGAPHWDPEARGTITGLTRGSTRAHLARATLEAIAFQVNDLIQSMGADSGQPLRRLRVDGGAAKNDILMQFQSDISKLSVQRPSELETTARGAAMLAGIGCGIFKSGEEAARIVSVDRQFEPTMTEEQRNSHLQEWQAALVRTRSSLA